MKCYLVKPKDDSCLEKYLLFASEPWKTSSNDWISTDDSYITIFGKEYFSDEIKLPEGDEIVELELTISASVPNNFRKGTRVSYTTFNISSFIFGGMIYGGYHDKHITEVLGVDWKHKKILIHKDGKKKEKSTIGTDLKLFDYDTSL